MPIYEYYCPACEGRYRHLARRIDGEAPPCPRCGHVEVERMVSVANVVHHEPHHEERLRGEAAQVDAENSRAVARFLKDSGRLEDATGVYGSSAYRELIHRRAQGATDADLEDLVDDLSREMRAATEASDLAGAVVFSDEVENRMGAEGPPEHHEHDPTSGEGSESQSSRSQRSAEDLGWA